MSSYLRKLNKVTVAPELLAEVMHLHATMPPENRRELTARACAVFALLDDRVPRDKLGPLTAAIDFRLTALMRLVADRAARGFTVPGAEQGLEMIHPDLVECAAGEPLIERGNELAFDADSFQQRLLGITEMRGKA